MYCTPAGDGKKSRHVTMIARMRIDAGVNWCLPFFLALSAGAILHESRAFYFFSDDYLNFVIASDMGFSRAYFVRDVFGQFVPLYRFCFLAYWHAFGLAFWPFRICCIGVNWTVIVVTWSIGRHWRVSPAVLLPAATLLACSPVFVTCVQWMSAALSVSGSTVAVLLALAVAARRRPLGWAGRIAMAALLLKGLALYPKALFCTVLIWSARAFVAAEALDCAAGEAARAATIDLVPALAVAAGYAAVVHFGAYSNGVARPDVATLLAFVGIGWNSGFLAVASGLGTSVPALVVGNCVALALLAASVCRSKRRWVLWLGFAAYFVVSIGLIGWNRAVPFGLATAQTARYYADVLCYALVFAMMALAPARGTIATPVSAGACAIVGVICMIGAAHLLTAAARVPHLWYAGPEKPARFVSNLSVALKSLQPEDTVGNSVVPDYVMPGWTSPLNQYRYFLPVFRFYGRVAPTQDATDAVTEAGQIVRLPGRSLGR